MNSVTFGVLAVLTDESDRVLLVRTTYADGWRLPGGFVEPGETPRQALERELSEELSIAPEDCRLVGVYYKIYENNLNLVFLGKACHTATHLQKSEIAEAGFFELTQLPVKVSPRALIILEDALLRRGPFIWTFCSPTKLLTA